MITNTIPENIKIQAINFIWTILIEKQSIAPDRIQLLQLLVTLTLYTNDIEKAQWLGENFNQEERVNALETNLTPWCINILKQIGIDGPPQSDSPNNITQINNINPIIP